MATNLQLKRSWNYQQKLQQEQQQQQQQYAHKLECCQYHRLPKYSSKSVNPPVTMKCLRDGSKVLCKKCIKPRYVPPFSTQSQQQNTIVIKGPIPEYKINNNYKNNKNNNKHHNNIKKFSMNKNNNNNNKITPFVSTKRTSSLSSSFKSSFRMYFDRGDLPIKMEYSSGGNRIAWTVNIARLDYNLYLPLFFDGLSETEHPYKTYARQAVIDLLIAGGDRILPIIPQLILPLKNALNTRNLEVMCTTMRIIQQLVLSSDAVGPALVPFYRQLLPIFNTYKVKNLNCGDEIDYAQKKNLNLGDIIDETLQILEMHGGEDAFINIKYMVPTYESCYLN